ncbi:MAG TPA: pentapeptide repeat-containing protein [Sedimenticola sp.]|nr:pentapeptide repeat-containing protein [Sedimenticola sp.]
MREKDDRVSLPPGEAAGEQAKSTRWFLRSSGGISGPFTCAHIRRGLMLNRIGPEHEASRDGKQWTRVGAVPELLPPRMRQGLQAGKGPLKRGAGKAGDTPGATDHRSLPVAVPLALALLALVVGGGIYIGAPTLVPESACARGATPGVNWRNCRLPALVADAADLRGANLESAQLKGGRFSGARLTRANLRFADFSAADISYAQLQGADLTGADLRDSDLSYADLSGADLRFADLRGANLGGALLDGSRFDHAIWVGGERCLPGPAGVCRRSD